VTGLLQRAPDLLDDAVAGRLLPLCLFVCFEHRRDQPAVREAISLLTAVHDRFGSAYEAYAASADPAIRSFLSQLQLTDSDGPEEDLAPPPSNSVAVTDVLARVRETVESAESAGLQAVLARLATEGDKAPIIRSLAARLTAGDGAGLAVALPALIRLSKGPFAAEIERALQTVGARVDSAVVLDAVVPLLGEEEPELFVDFLTRVIAVARREAVAPRVREILGRITPLLHHQVPIVRKNSVLCIVEMRVVVGPDFDPEIAALKSLPRKLVMHYLERRLGE
jgi:hypothetical protein